MKFWAEIEADVRNEEDAQMVRDAIIAAIRTARTQEVPGFLGLAHHVAPKSVVVESEIDRLLAIESRA